MQSPHLQRQIVYSIPKTCRMKWNGIRANFTLSIRQNVNAETRDLNKVNWMYPLSSQPRGRVVQAEEMLPDVCTDRIHPGRLLQGPPCARRYTWLWLLSRGYISRGPVLSGLIFCWAWIGSAGEWAQLLRRWRCCKASRWCVCRGLGEVGPSAPDAGEGSPESHRALKTPDRKAALQGVQAEGLVTKALTSECAWKQDQCQRLNQNDPNMMIWREWEDQTHLELCGSLVRIS